MTDVGFLYRWDMAGDPVNAVVKWLWRLRPLCGPASLCATLLSVSDFFFVGKSPVATPKVSMSVDCKMLTLSPMFIFT